MWFVLALLAGLLFAVNRMLLRDVLTKGSKPLAFVSAHDLLAGLLLVPIALLNLSLPQSGKTWLALILCILCIFLSDLFAALSLQKVEASMYQIVAQLRHIVVLFGAYFFFTEVITLSKIVSIVLIMVGVAISLLDKGRIKITSGIVYAAINAVFIGFGFMFAKMAAVDVKPAVIAALSLTMSGILLYLLLIIRRERPIKFVPSRNRKQLIIAVVLFAVFEFTLFTALDIGEASRVTPVTQSSMIFTLIGGYIYLNEKTRLKQKIIGSLLIAAGIGLLYFI